MLSLLDEHSTTVCACSFPAASRHSLSVWQPAGMEQGPQSISWKCCVGSKGDVLSENVVVLPSWFQSGCTSGCSCWWSRGNWCGLMPLDTGALGVLLWQCMPAWKGKQELDIHCTSERWGRRTALHWDIRRVLGSYACFFSILGGFGLFIVATDVQVSGGLIVVDSVLM